MDTDTLPKAPRHSTHAAITAGELLPLLLKKNQLADFLGCSVRHVTELTRRGLLHPVRLGASVRFRRDAVLRDLERLEAKGGA
jgi:excisionase family DNA binding protein